MKMKLLGASVLLVIVGCSAPEGEEAATGTAWWGFDDTEVGAFPSDFTALVGEWEVVEDSTAPSGGRALAQQAESPPPDFNVVLVDDLSYQTIDISVSFRSIAGEVDQGGGLVWRAKDVNNYYIARYNPLEDNYRVYKVVEGKRLQLQSSDLDQTPGWHTLRVTMVGDLIRCFYDDEQCLEVQDTTFAGAGQVGLWTKADAQTHFDDLMVVR
jgi:hypothetical protein